MVHILLLYCKHYTLLVYILGKLHLVGVSFVVTAAHVTLNTACPIEVVVYIAGTALSTGGGAGDNVREAGTWGGTDLRAALVMAVGRTVQGYTGID